MIGRKAWEGNSAYASHYRLALGAERTLSPPTAAAMPLARMKFRKPDVPMAKAVGQPALGGVVGKVKSNGRAARAANHGDIATKLAFFFCVAIENCPK
jgi:hypothetical protein